MRIPKSGKVTINLGPNEVKQILENPTRHPRAVGYGSRYQNIDSKLYNVVAKKFSDVAANMEEELKARTICYTMRDSDAWKTLLAGFTVERKAINAMFEELNRKESAAMNQLVQQAFDEAGVTNFEARGYGFRRVVKS